jgi:hypothetical protein
MKQTMETPIRLVDRAVDPARPELGEAQASLGAAILTAPKLSESAQRRIGRRLQSSIARERSPRARLGFAVAFGLAMLVSGVVGATVGSVVTSWLAQHRAAKESPPRARLTPERRRVHTPVKAPSTLNPPDTPPRPESPRVEAATVESVSISETRSPTRPPRPATAELGGRARAPVLRQALRSSLDAERPSRPAPSPAPPAVDEPRLTEAPSGTRLPSLAPGPLPRYESQPLVAAPGPGTHRPGAAAANPGDDEAAMVGHAIRLLRVQGNPQSALALLEKGGPALMHGSFGPEVAALRIEGLLALGRTSAALDDLERLSIATLPKATEWLVVRAELRGKAGRWPLAEEDFSAALAARQGALRPELEQRALWGRIVARLHQGNTAVARSDAQDYLRRFPHGRFRSQAEKAAAAPSP